MRYKVRSLLGRYSIYPPLRGLYTYSAVMVSAALMSSFMLSWCQLEPTRQYSDQLTTSKLIDHNESLFDAHVHPSAGSPKSPNFVKLRRVVSFAVCIVLASFASVS